MSPLLDLKYSSRIQATGDVQYLCLPGSDMISYIYGCMIFYIQWFGGPCVQCLAWCQFSTKELIARHFTVSKYEIIL